jgi:hypothetical protein
MFLTKKHLSRRTVLKGAGVSLALPLLDAMIPAATALAQTAAAPKLRVGFFYIPHGAIQWNTAHGPAMDRWNPSGSGASFKLSEILSPLEEFKHLVTSFSHLENKANENSVHAIVPSTWLSGTRPDSRSQSASMSTTIDQMIAARIGQETALPSLEVASELTAQQAACPSGVGASDRVLLDQYMSTVREIERRVQMAEQRDLSAITLPEAPIGELESFDEQVKLMFDLIVLAYQANLTRVTSYIMVAEGTQRTYNHIGVPDAFHPLSHHANKMESLEKLVRIQKYHVERFAGFVKKLAQIPDGDGSLLDHSLFMYGSNMSNSDRHNNYPLPNILVGGANGGLKGGQQVELPEHTPLTNLLLTVLNKAGLEMKSFADSTGEIAGV